MCPECYNLGPFFCAAMEFLMRFRSRVSALAVLGLSLPLAPVLAADSNEALAKLAQNPVASLISVPFQNNTNFNYGPDDDTQDILNIQPVIPITLNEDWNLITRTIIPLVWQPIPGEGTEFGLGNPQLSLFASPSKPGAGGLIWGAGAIIQVPIDSNDLGNDNWGLGPAMVALKIKPGSPWVYGFLMNNVWSLSSSGRGGSYSNFLLQPFVNYNFKGGLYLTSSPIITASWEAPSDDQWTVPIGGGVGKIFRLGKLPVNGQISGYYNIEKPEFGADWQLRVQLQLMFPK
jgi:hypothetical protein